MEGTLNLTITAVTNKGLIEVGFHLLQILWNKVYSLLMILFWRLRGYYLHFSVSLGGSNIFFQSTTRAIKIEKNSRLGKGTKISAGFKGTIEIGENVLLDDYCYIMAQQSVIIGKNTQIAAFCYITDFNHLFSDSNRTIKEQGYETKPVVIGEDVWMGAGCIILSGVLVGKGAVIGAGSVVTKNIPPYSIAVGNPANVIKKRS